MKPLDLALSHTWGGALITPQTDLGRDWCASHLCEDGERGWLCAETEDGGYLVDHKDGLVVAEAAKRAGLTFNNSDKLP